jgi:hypothetical protein
MHGFFAKPRENAAHFRFGKNYLPPVENAYVSLLVRNRCRHFRAKAQFRDFFSVKRPRKKTAESPARSFGQAKKHLIYSIQTLFSLNK